MAQAFLRRALKVHGAWIALCLAVALTACSKPPSFRGTVTEGVKWGGDFELTAHTGQRLRTADYRGKLLVLFFGYTQCPDACVPTLAKLAQLSRPLGRDAERIQVLFISVDPEHDSPARLKEFLAGFDPAFIGLTGTLDELSAVAADHMVFFKQARAGRIEHTGMLFVKDAKGRLRLLIKESASREDMLNDLGLLLRE
jgi:protein SCO1